MYQVRKRNGDSVIFDLSKIQTALTKSFESCNRNYQDVIVEKLAMKAVARAEQKIKDNLLSVEDIQDAVESVLMSYGYEDVAKAYILYRKQHEKARNAQETVLDYKKTIEGYTNASDWRVKENASIDYSLGGLILGNSGAVTANYWLSEIYDEEIATAHRNCDIHIHDLSMLSAYCNGASLKQLIKEGLGGVPRKISSKPASHLSTLCNQIVNFMGVLSLEFAGAQALSSVDTYLAPFVKVDDLSYKEVRQCIQSLVFGLNTPSRWGCLKLDTRVATPSGFKYYNELNKGDLIYTYVDGKLSTAHINSVIVKENESGEMHTYYGNNYVQTVTPEHRCIIKISDTDIRVIRSSELMNLLNMGYSVYVPSGVSENQDGTIDLADNTFIKIEKYEVNKYDGTVWCPSTDDGTAIYKDADGNIFISGNCQPVFSNFTIDWTVPDDLAELNCIVGGKEVDFKYKECKREMDMINRAFLEIMVEGDADGRSFAYPILTYSITKDFDWDQEILNNRLLFEMTAKYGIPYFSNYVNSDMSPQDTRSMCCRLRLNLRELRRKNGGYFGSGDQTGSVGVVTINMPRLAYKSKDESDFYDRLEHLMDVCSRSLEIKRKVVSDLLEAGLYPYTKRYLGNFNNHFSTIATNGMNEMCLNACWIKDDIASEKGYEFAKNVLDFMRNKLSDYQEQTGNLYNLESAPAESTCVVESDYICTTLGNISVKDILNMTEEERNDLGIMTVNHETNELEVKHLVDIWQTKKDAKCLRVYFDNGDSITVTPDHKIAKRFVSGVGSSRKSEIRYVRADELSANDRLVALSKFIRDGSESGYVTYKIGLFTNNSLCFSEHNLFGEFYYGKRPDGYVFHHKDENKKNNTKENLVMMSDSEHRALHGKKDGYKYLPHGSGEDNNFYGKHHTDEAKQKMSMKSRPDTYDEWYANICKSCRSDEFRQKMSEIAKNKLPEKHSKYKHDCSTETIIELWNSGMSVSQIVRALGGNYTYSLVKGRLTKAGFVPNHKIIKIEELEETYPVYDIEVEDNHNFFVSGTSDKMGVLVHNCYRFALHDKKDFPDIITAGDKTDGAPYYTNSSNLPVNYTDDIFTALDHQDELQTKYTGGTVFHAFLGEKLPNWESAMMLTKKIAENYKLPYFTFSPTYSICPDHGYIRGEEWTCPECGKKTEVYSRVTGYYRAVQNFNDGKAHEFKDRKEYKVGDLTASEDSCEACSTGYTELPEQSIEEDTETAVRKILAPTRKPMLFTTATCPNCKMAKRFISEAGFDCDILLAEENAELVNLYKVSQAPTLIVFNDGEPQTISNVSNIRKYLESINK